MVGATEIALRITAGMIGQETGSINVGGPSFEDALRLVRRMTMMESSAAASACSYRLRSNNAVATVALPTTRRPESSCDFILNEGIKVLTTIAKQTDRGDQETFALPSPRLG